MDDLNKNENLENLNQDENLEDAIQDVNMEDDDLDNSVVLTDEDGVERKFEFLDYIEYNEKEYIVLLPDENMENGEVVIFRIEGKGEDETYVGVDSEEEANTIFNIFKEKSKDNFTFEE